MSLAFTDVSRLAEQLHDAERSTAPTEPLRDQLPLTVSDAYAVQLEGVRRRVELGDKIRGHKVGLTASVMQAQFGVAQPDFGHLLASMFHPETIPLLTADLIAPRIEPEIAFVLSDDLRGPGVHVADVLACTAFVLPALEVIDSRIKDWDITIVDTIADNASSARVVLGGSAVSVRDIDPRVVGVVLTRNGEVVETGASGAVLGNPAYAIAWLANTISEHGAFLSAGDVVMPGTCTRAVPIEPGDVVRADFDGLGFVTTSIEVAA